MTEHLFKGPTDVDCRNLVEHEIHIENEAPFKDSYRRIPPALIQEVREHLNEMVETGAILPYKVRKTARIRNIYNQVLQLVIVPGYQMGRLQNRNKQEPRGQPFPLR